MVDSGYFGAKHARTAQPLLNVNNKNRLAGKKYMFKVTRVNSRRLVVAFNPE